MAKARAQFSIVYAVLCMGQKVVAAGALATVIKRQNKDGSWGRKERETETFLVLDAL